MDSTPTIRSFLYKYAYLLIVSAWLVTIAFIIDNYWSANSSLKRAEELIKSDLAKQEDDLAETLKDTVLISKIEGKNKLLTQKETNGLQSKKYFLFFYNLNDTLSGNPYYWNTQKVLPTNSMLTDSLAKGFVMLGNGYFIWEKNHTAGSKIISLIPIKWQYDSSIYDNKVLPSDFSVNGIVSDHYKIEANNLQFNRTSNDNSAEYFKLVDLKTEDKLIQKNNPISILLNLTALIFILFFIQLLVTFISQKYNLYYGLSLLVLSSFIMATISRKSWLPVNLRQFELFDPMVYGLKNIFTSMGDLIIRFLLLLWLIIFLRGRFRASEIVWKLKGNVQKWIVIILGAILTVFSTYFLASMIRSMVMDSKISFDVMDFFSLNKFTFFGFLSISVMIITYFFFNCLIINFIKSQFRNFLLPLFFAIILTALFLLSLMIGKIDDINFEFYLVGWLLLFIFLLNSNLSDFIAEDKIIASKLVFWLVFFSISASFVIQSKSVNKELDRRLSFAKTIAYKSDPSIVYMVNPYFNGINMYINPSNIEKLSNENPGLTNLIDSLNQVNKVQTCKENFNLFLFGFSADSTSRILINKNLLTLSNEFKPFNELNNLFLRYSKATIGSNVRYFESEPSSVAYISRKIVYENDSKINLNNQVADTTKKMLAYYFILALPKKGISGNGMIKGKLLQNAKSLNLNYTGAYSWAIYKKTDGKIYGLSESGNYYPFKYTLAFNESEFVDNKVLQNGLYSELWYNAGGQKMICVVKENSILSAVTFFSYFFCSFLVIVLLLWFISVVIRARLNYRQIIDYWRLSIRNQIHLSIISLSVLSFFIVGVTTIWFFKTKSDETNTEKVRNMVAAERLEIEKILSSYDEDFIDINDENIKSTLRKKIDEFSESQNLDLVVYNLDGSLHSASSTILSIFDKNILSKMMNPVAFDHLARKKEISFSQEESIGDLRYISNYIAISNLRNANSSKVLAYLNVPYMESENNLKKDISNFLVAIINLNAFIFLIAGIISLFITQRISRSFSFISEKMKKINLTKQNEYIDWNRDDEIGELISEYNKMVFKLQESADALAKTEREGAWREMAKQVAHEIKNPLTPMKLNLQFLQRAITNNDPNVKEMASRMSVTLIEQIDHLSNIAGQFSQFANISESRSEVINIHDLIKSVIQLLATTNEVIIEHELSSGKLFINADRTQMNRLFTNLMLNAIQSVPESRKAIVNVKEILGEETVTIIIQDNGTGIDPSVIEKIFTPNFTTKNSGTGLGLAMCKKIVEQAGGEIWFETENDNGTSFFVRLPKSLDQ